MKTILVTLILAVAILSACGNTMNVQGVAQKEKPAAASVSSSSSTENAEDTEPQKDTASSRPDEAAVTEASADSDFGSEFAMFKKEQTIEETVLYDENDVRITATSLNYGDSNVELNVTLENHSDTDLTFLAGTMGYSCNAVNGWMIEDGWINEDVAAGGSVDTTVRFNTTELLFHGITEIADIQVGFEIEDADYNRIYTGPLTITTPLAASYDYDNDIYRKAINSRALQLNYDYTIDAFAEKEAYNEGGIRILSEAYMINTDGDRTLMLEVKNDNDHAVYMATNNIKANDTLIYEDLWSAVAINPSCRAVEDIRLDDILSEEEWEEYGIEKIESVSFTVNIMNEDGIIIAEPKEIMINL